MKGHLRLLTGICLAFTMTSGYGQLKPAGSWDPQFGTQGLLGTALALAQGGGYVYAGGSFSSAGGVSVNGIAKWDGSEWHAMGTGMNGTVREIVVAGGMVYAGGSFTTAGGVTANRIAMWNGTSWSALGSGVNGDVYAIAVDGSDVYAGGQFDHAGGITANNIARWDGGTWHALGDGISHSDPGVTPVVYDILDRGNIYAGGKFDTAGGTAVINIAYWDGSSWYAAGNGVTGLEMEDQYVLCLCHDWHQFYAGGSNETTYMEYFAGGPVTFIEIANVYQTDYAGNWINIGDAADGTFGSPKIHKLGYAGEFLYAGGDFSDETVTVGDVPYTWVFTPDINTNGIAQMEYGSAWQGLGGGVNGTVYDLIAKASEVWVAGDFSLAGGIVSANIGRYQFSTYPDLSLIRVPSDYTTIQEAIDAATDGDTILVAPGVYPISASINNDRVHDLIIMGSREPDGSDASVIDAGSAPGTFMCIRNADVHGIKISGFEIINGAEGMAFDNCSNCECTENYLHDNQVGVAFWNSSQMSVSYSIMDQNTSRGIGIWQSNYVDVDHNTILRSLNYEGMSISGASDHVTITSNIFAFNAQEGLDTQSITMTDFDHDYNLFYQNPSGDISGHVIGSHSLIADPMLQDMNNENFYLQSGSPCLGNGEGGSDIGALGIWTGGTNVDTESSGMITRFELHQNYPNPFNPETIIPYSIPKASHVELSIYNLRGEKISTLINGHKTTGHYSVEWKGKDEAGNSVASGIYLVRLEADSFVQTKKMLFVR